MKLFTNKLIRRVNNIEDIVVRSLFMINKSLKSKLKKTKRVYKPIKYQQELVAFGKKKKSKKNKKKC